MAAPAPRSPSPWAPFMSSASAPAIIATTAPKTAPKLKLKMRQPKSSTISNSQSPFSVGKKVGDILAPSSCPSPTPYSPAESSNMQGSNEDSGYESGTTNTNIRSPMQINATSHSNGMKRSLGMYDKDLPAAQDSQKPSKKLKVKGKDIVPQTKLPQSAQPISPIPWGSNSFSLINNVRPCLWEQLPNIDPGTKIVSDPFAADRARGVRFIRIDENIDPLAPIPKVKFRVRLPANEVDEKMQAWLDWRTERRVTRSSTSFGFHVNSAKTQAEKNKEKKQSPVKPFYKR